MQLSRRHFLATGTALPLLAVPQASRPGQAWYQKMRRCGQVNFNEMDPIERRTHRFVTRLKG